MRLIDADALSELLVKTYEKAPTEKALLFVALLLKNSEQVPTVFDCRSCKNNGNERECIDCHDYSNYVHYEERPQGEWIDYKNHIGCNKCKVWFLKDYLIRKSFCPNCGAAMNNQEVQE